mmetsp:Transcript_31220/g.47640  ORF Transcript_31220/g.47640 Transcript_31220/m.47640 type:complete len:209 (-) Transcript_31220:165-791(-)
MGRNQPATEDYVIVETPDDMYGYLSDDTPCSSFDLCDDVSYSIQLNMSICSDTSDISLQKWDEKTENSCDGEDLDEINAESKVITMPDSEKLNTGRSLISKDPSITVVNSSELGEKTESVNPTEPFETISMSRASNKKRRKKLKMMKKAQAASNAVKSLADQDLVKKSKKAKARGKKCPSLKKVKNIAVTCANESLATYRQEHGILNQ